MKKIISTVLVCVLLVSSVFALASCGALSGTYEYTEEIIGVSTTTTLEFSGDKVKISTKAGATTSEYEAKYEIIGEGEGRKIVFTYEDGAHKHLTLQGERSFADGEQNGKKYIKIGIVEYYKK